jgi:hypothetical protein
MRHAPSTDHNAGPRTGGGRGHRPWRIAALLVALPLAVGACSSDDEPDICEDLRSFQATLQSVLSVNVTSQGPDEVADQVELAKGTLQTVREDAAEVFADDLAAVESSLNEFESLIEDLQAGTPVSDLAVDIDETASGLRTALDGLVETARAQDCDLGS